jgi:hypothetical protein
MGYDVAKKENARWMSRDSFFGGVAWGSHGRDPQKQKRSASVARAEVTMRFWSIRTRIFEFAASV